jgi:hypothetical protein
LNYDFAKAIMMHMESAAVPKLKRHVDQAAQMLMTTPKSKKTNDCDDIKTARETLVLLVRLMFLTVKNQQQYLAQSWPNTDATPTPTLLALLGHVGTWIMASFTPFGDKFIRYTSGILSAQSFRTGSNDASRHEFLRHVSDTHTAVQGVLNELQTRASAPQKEKEIIAPRRNSNTNIRPASMLSPSPIRDAARLSVATSPSSAGNLAPPSPSSSRGGLGRSSSKDSLISVKSPGPLAGSNEWTVALVVHDVNAFLEKLQSILTESSGGSTDSI